MVKTDWVQVWIFLQWGRVGWVVKGWHLSDTETPDIRCDHTILFLPSPVTPEICYFQLFSCGLCRPEIFTGSHCFSLDPFSSVRLLQLGIISYCISSILRWAITKHRACTQLIRLWKRKDGNQLSVPQLEHNDGPTSLEGTRSCCPLPGDHQPQPLCTHSTAPVEAFQEMLVLACWTNSTTYEPVRLLKSPSQIRSYQ